MPRAGLCLLEHQHVVVRLSRFETEHFDERTGVLAKMQTGLDDARVVHHHERTFGQQLGQIAEMAMCNRAVVVNQKLGTVALCQRIFGDTLVGQLVSEVGNLYVFRISHNLITS